MTTIGTRARIGNVLDVVGVAEIARKLGVSRQRVHEIIRSDTDFPEPAAELSAGRIWKAPDVERWMSARERRAKEVEVEDVNGLKLVSPVRFADMQVVGDQIRAGKPVAVELRNLDVMERRRCIDFVSGAGYVAGGAVERVAEGAYLFVPVGSTVSARQRAGLLDRLD